MKMFKRYYLLTILLPVFALSGCGGSSSGTGSANSNITTGVVTSKNTNSVTVAGTSFNTSGATVSGNEISSTSEIQVGMMLSVESDDSGNVENIEYDAEVEGVVDSISADTMVVMGQMVDISQSPAFVSEMMGITDISGIPIGAMVEVSGYSDGMGNIIATYVKLEDHMADENDHMELEGIVTSLDSTNGTFMIGNQVIYYDPASIELVLEEGMNVEVDIMMDVSGDLHATEIEIEEDFAEGGSEGDSIHIEGMISGDLGLDGTFTINGETVMLGESVHFEDGLSAASIIDGAHLVVEGHLNADGVLVVTEVRTPGM